MEANARKYKYRFSVILCTYNAEYEEVKLSVDSIITQKFKSFELIISEDGSESSWMEKIESYLIENKFFDYKLRKNEKNLGTVKNYYEALNIAEGKYVKGLGVADYLYDDLALKKMYIFLEKNHYRFGFCRANKYKIENGKMIELGEYIAPQNFGIYQKKLWKLYSQINILALQDWVCGAKIFGLKDDMKHYVGLLRGISKYSEDILQVFVLGDKRNIYFLDETIIGYEYGSGISTKKGMNKMKKALIKDIDNSTSYALDIYRRRPLFCFLLKIGRSHTTIMRDILKFFFENEKFLI